MLKKLISLSFGVYLKNIYIRVFFVLLISPILPLYIKNIMSEGFFRFIIVSFVAVFSVCLSVYIGGLTKNERMLINSKVSSLIHRFKR